MSSDWSAVGVGGASLVAGVCEDLLPSISQASAASKSLLVMTAGSGDCVYKVNSLVLR